MTSYLSNCLGFVSQQPVEFQDRHSPDLCSIYYSASFGSVSCESVPAMSLSDLRSRKQTTSLLLKIGLLCPPQQEKNPQAFFREQLAVCLIGRVFFDSGWWCILFTVGKIFGFPMYKNQAFLLSSEGPPKPMNQFGIFVWMSYLEDHPS